MRETPARCANVLNWRSGTKQKLARMSLIRTSRVLVALADLIGKQVRIIPELNFYLDDSLDYYEAVDQALKG